MVMRAFDSLAGRAPKTALEFPDEVAQIVRGQLSRGNVFAASVAGAMNLSTRSLQRRLSAHGVTLKSIVDAEKEKLANPKGTRTGCVDKEGLSPLLQNCS
jgi:hypothetical protein